MFLDPLGDLWKMLVLLSDVVLLTKIDEVDNGLCAEEKKRIYDFDLAANAD